MRSLGGTEVRGGGAGGRCEGMGSGRGEERGERAERVGGRWVPGSAARGREARGEVSGERGR